MLTCILIGTHKKKHGSFIKELTIMQGGSKLNTESKENTISMIAIWKNLIQARLCLPVFVYLCMEDTLSVLRSCLPC